MLAFSKAIQEMSNHNLWIFINTAYCLIFTGSYFTYCYYYLGKLLDIFFQLLSNFTENIPFTFSQRQAVSLDLGAFKGNPSGNALSIIFCSQLNSGRQNENQSSILLGEEVIMYSQMTQGDSETSNLNTLYITHYKIQCFWKYTIWSYLLLLINFLTAQ